MGVYLFCGSKLFFQVLLYLLHAMPKLTKEQKFLYSRVAMLLFGVGWVLFAFAGLKGFSFWYGGFVLCFWLALGCSNYAERTTLWLIANRPVPFLIFYAAIASTFFLLDRMAIDAGLWFYPMYHGWLFVVGYLVWYPVAAFSVLEFFYFLIRVFGERLVFRHRKETFWHNTLDRIEGVAFLAMIGLIVWGAAASISPVLLFSVASVWILLASMKLAFHVQNGRQTALLLAVTGFLVALLTEIPNTGSFEWVYLSAPVLNVLLWGVPLWMLLGWYCFTLISLRLWIFLALHPPHQINT